MKDILFVFFTALFVAFVIFSFYVIGVLCDYYDSFHANDENYINLSFRGFISAYRCAPNRFNIKRNKIEYKSKKYKEYKIAFISIFDYLKYINWFKRHKKLEKRRKIDKNTEELINDITYKGEL